jgi:hypothetical protein
MFQDEKPGAAMTCCNAVVGRENDTLWADEEEKVGSVGSE